MCMGGMQGMGMGPMIFMGVIQILFWVAIIYAAVRLIRYFRSERVGQGNRKAVEILREEFAKGNISAEEYQSRLNVLNRS